MQLKRYNHKVILEDGTELIPIKTQGSVQLMGEAYKRIGCSDFYGVYSKGAEICGGFNGQGTSIQHYLTPEKYDKFNNWEDLSAFEQKGGE